MGVIKTFRKRSRQNRLVQENMQLRHLGRSLWTALEEYANPLNWTKVDGAYTWNGKPIDVGYLAREALGVNHEDSGEHCGELHKNDAKHPIQECFYCKLCKEWIRGDDAGRMGWCMGEEFRKAVLE